MWYLTAKTLLLISAFTALYAAAGAVLRRFRPEGRGLSPLLILFDLALLVYVSLKLACFYLLYTGVSYALVLLLRRAKGGRRGLFVVFCLLDILPLVYVRSASFGLSLPVWFALVGFAYNMLKAVDALYYVYYTEKSIPLLTYCNYILFFPVLTGGPIYRYRDFLAAYERPVPLDAGSVLWSVKRVILGMFKKLVLVAWLTGAESLLYAGGRHFYLSLLLIVVSYLALYFDLSGYSDIAIGFSRLVGIPAPENFKKPWEAATFTQFWRKWHVSLSDWIREHIFVVLNGRRLNKYASALIAVITMLVMAAWHGFNTSELICGVFLGLFLALENLTGQTTVNRRKANKAVYWLRCLCVSLLFGINAMFYFLDAKQVLYVLGGLFHR